MHGREAAAANLFSDVRLEDRVPADHPPQPIRALADEVLAGLSARFEGLYARLGRPSILPEMMLRATLPQAFFSVRSERMLMEPIDCNLLVRWFVGLEIDVAVWHPTVFTHTLVRFPKPLAQIAA
ncbi:transposase [uncultured Methylobacterium sp.]|uniref:transposase n=1 Tax=uncultured Methylobacterium sp. TaxID=157278 RepID=UPI0035CADB2A